MSKSEQDAEKLGEHRNIARLLGVMESLSKASADGLRLTDIVAASGLGKTTAHRILNGLAAFGLVDQDPESGRYYVGLTILAWATAARDRFALSRLAAPTLQRIVRQTQDTIYLVVRVGDEIVCIDWREGTFPIKALTLNLGDRRPLGIGAGSLSILSALPDEEIDRYFASNADMLSRYPFDEVKLRRMIATTRADGYAYNNVHVLPGLENLTDMAGIGVPIRKRDGIPVAALHLTAITQRFEPPRREMLVELLRGEAQHIEQELAPLLEIAGLSQGRAIRTAAIG